MIRKYLLALVVIVIAQLHTFAQSSYPRIETDSLGQSVVVMTVAQAQKLDNAVDLLAMFESMNADIDQYNDACIKVVNDQGKLIESLGQDIASLKELYAVKSTQVDTLQASINLYISKDLLWQGETDNLRKISEEYKDEVRRGKMRSLIGGSASGIIIIGLITALILK